MSRDSKKTKPSASFRQANSAGQASLSAVIASSRATGTLNLSSRALDQVPPAVYNHDDALPGSDTNWWEVAELSKLDLSRNAICELPEALYQLTSLTLLDISSNKLAGIPAGIEQLSLLRSLSLSHNPLTTISEAIAQLPALASLSCSNCELQQLPQQLGRHQPVLSAVSAGGNKLQHLPAGLRSATALVKLDLQSNQLEGLEADMLACWPNLAELNLSQNRLLSLPDSIGCLTSLKMLYLRENQLASLPQGLSGCISLLELHAGFNNLTALPEGLSMCGQLRVLDVRNNVLQDIPDPLCSLQLTLFDLTNNSLRSLPPKLGLMTSLRSIPLEGNPLKLMRRELWSGPVSALLSHLQSRLPDPSAEDTNTNLSAYARSAAARSGNVFGVDETSAVADAARKLALSSVSGQELILKGRGLNNIPEEVWQVAPVLARLDLSNNPVGQLPADVLLGMTQLRLLSLANMSLTQWPLPLLPGALAQLTTLEVRNNPFSSLPALGLCACPALRSLDLSAVAAAAQLPLGFLSVVGKLETLSLAAVGLTEFPQQVLQLPAIRILNMETNKLTSVPMEVTVLTRLEELNLTNNELSSLPPQLGLMAPVLRALCVEGNMLRTIRRPILARGTPALLEYLKDRIPA